MPNLYQASASINNLEEMALRKSAVHNFHPMAKLLTTIVYIVMVISFSQQNISGLAAFLFYPVIIMSVSNTPYKPLLKRLLVALPFSLMGGISNILFLRNAAFYIGGIAVTTGMVSFVAIMLKTFMSVFAVLILIATTPFTEISAQLIILHVPKILCLQLVMTYRYLSVLIEEAFSMFTAYNMRNPAPENKKKSGIKMRDMGIFLGQLILRSFDRAERVYNSMKCRGFDGSYATNGIYKNFRVNDVIYTIGIIAAVIFLRFFNLSLFLGKIV
ncbi:MAG: cobalt ECF transporter T component CbiQ [Oscillospiraceae bacterium]|nr:cobalt ECF transporter T component CbiQ [Oscillospiraceae bacterium]